MTWYWMIIQEVPARGEAYAARTLVLATIELDSGTLYRAGKPVRHPTRYYQGKVKSWGTVTRSMPVPVGVPHVGDALVEVVDTDGELRRLMAGTPPQGRTVTLKIGPEGGRESLFYTAYTGEIKHVSFPPGLARMALQDKTWRFFDEELPDLLVRREWVPDAAGGDPGDPDAADRWFARNLRKRSKGAGTKKRYFHPLYWVPSRARARTPVAP